MQNPQNFLNNLNSFKGKIDLNLVPANNFNAIRSIIAEETFTPENMAKKSSAAAGICDWIKNITCYFDVFVSVEPKKLAVKEAEQQLAEANTKKEEMEALVAKLNAELAEL